MFHMRDAQDCYPSQTCSNYKLQSAYNFECIMLCHFSFSSFVIKPQSNSIIKKVIISLRDRLGHTTERYTCSELIFKSRLELRVTVAEAIMAEIQLSSSEQQLFNTTMLAKFCYPNLV